jgi:hypothetical protein
MTRLERRVMAFLTGINDERTTRARIARAVHRSERSVKVAIAGLVEKRWISCSHSGHGKPGKITIINAVAWISAPESKSAPESRISAPECVKTAPERPRIKDLGKVLEQEQKQARKPQGVEIPPEFLTTPGGRPYLNPAWVRVRDALHLAHISGRMARAHDPEAYKRAIIAKEAQA